MTPTHITGIRTVSIPVGDQDAALRFYRGTLGFTVLRDNPTPNGGRWIELAPGGDNAIVTLEPAAPDVTRGAIGIRFTTDDAQAAHAALLAAGVDVDEFALARRTGHVRLPRPRRQRLLDYRDGVAGPQPVPPADSLGFQWYCFPMEAVVDQAGRIVLPKSIRDALGLLPGTKVDISPYGAGVQVLPAGRTARLVEEDGVLVSAGETPVDDDILFGLIDAGRK